MPRDKTCCRLSPVRPGMAQRPVNSPGHFLTLRVNLTFRPKRLVAPTPCLRHDRSPARSGDEALLRRRSLSLHRPDTRIVAETRIVTWQRRTIKRALGVFIASASRGRDQSLTLILWRVQEFCKSKPSVNSVAEGPHEIRLLRERAPLIFKLHCSVSSSGNKPLIVEAHTPTPNIFAYSRTADAFTSSKLRVFRRFLHLTVSNLEGKSETQTVTRTPGRNCRHSYFNFKEQAKRNARGDGYETRYFSPTSDSRCCAPHASSTALRA